MDVTLTFALDLRNGYPAAQTTLVWLGSQSLSLGLEMIERHQDGQNDRNKIKKENLKHQKNTDLHPIKRISFQQLFNNNAQRTYTSSGKHKQVTR